MDYFPTFEYTIYIDDYAQMLHTQHKKSSMHSDVTSYEPHENSSNQRDHILISTEENSHEFHHLTSDDSFISGLEVDLNNDPFEEIHEAIEE